VVSITDAAIQDFLVLLDVRSTRHHVRRLLRRLQRLQLAVNQAAIQEWQQRRQQRQEQQRQRLEQYEQDVSASRLRLEKEIDILQRRIRELEVQLGVLGAVSRVSATMWGGVENSHGGGKNPIT
jgi:DNA anti-recombination protein RmuC